MVISHPAVRDFLEAHSVDPVRLGGGMEGAVFALDPARVAKVWRRRSLESAERLAVFSAGLDRLDLPFSVPVTLEVHDVSGITVSIERRLTGRPLDQAIVDGTVTAGEARALLVDLLGGLAAAGPLEAARQLPVLDERHPLVGSLPFGTALAQLVRRRAECSSALLDAAVDDFGTKLAALTTLLPTMDRRTRAVLYGDLFPGNVLVDGAGRAGVLDWGFMTTEGDPAFDAATTAALFDMYGPHALQDELAFLDEAADRLGYDRRALLVHRAAYSLATATAYSPDGSDGHFAWCVRALNRGDVTTALLG